MPSHRAIGLISSPDLRQQVTNLLPNYAFTWELPLEDAIRQAADLRPSFLIADIEASHWQEVVIALLSNPATRRIPLLGMISYQDDVLLKKAYPINSLILYKDLAARLPDWVERHARVWDAAYYTALEDQCSAELPPLAQEGIVLFNQQEFWEAHEVLEQAWIATRPHPISEVYRSILQVGVAYYQIQQKNYRGAIKMFLRAVQWLDPLPDECQGIDLAQFKQDAAKARGVLEALGQERIGEFDMSLFKPVPMVKKA